MRKFKRNAYALVPSPHEDTYNPLRYGLRRVRYDYQTGELFVRKWIVHGFAHGQPLSIDKYFHPEIYYIAGIRGCFVHWAPNGSSANPDSTPYKFTIRFSVNENTIEQYCNEMKKKIPSFTDEYYFPNLVKRNKFLKKEKLCTPTDQDILICLMRLEDA